MHVKSQDVILPLLSDTFQQRQTLIWITGCIQHLLLSNTVNNLADPNKTNTQNQTMKNLKTLLTAAYKNQIDVNSLFQAQWNLRRVTLQDSFWNTICQVLHVLKSTAVQKKVWFAEVIKYAAVCGIRRIHIVSNVVIKDTGIWSCHLTSGMPLPLSKMFISLVVRRNRLCMKKIWLWNKSLKNRILFPS